MVNVKTNSGSGALTDTSEISKDKPLLEIRGVSKKFGDFIAVNNVDLDIYQGELFCLLGGSGCGKTTLLRMLAGFEKPSSGQILIDGQDMSEVPPYKRPTNMMFQNYALFPHMTVEKNIAFGLEQDGISKAEISDKIDSILKLVELQDYKKRRPQQLSGGQRQRVALARALVKQPKLLLLDEPLSALDKKLREQTQFELMNIQDKVGVTFVVVTHDQEEAMTLSTRIAVMDRGRFIQTGTPTEIYEYPRDRFVADFIGSANILDGKVVSNLEGTIEVSTYLGKFSFKSSSNISEGSDLFLCLRPEKISISKATSKSKNTTGFIDDIGYFGDYSIYKVRLDEGKIIDVTAQNQKRPKNAKDRLTYEDKVNLNWDNSSAMLLLK
ncbi:MAG: ABC transporter ATP-binding protein [Paracoccaceae bacterium]|nr:ABC transporter ATP-binding protein [Paracoccaceae bacterium]